jgi:hypothetical protein
MFWHCLKLAVLCIQLFEVVVRLAARSLPLLCYRPPCYRPPPPMPSMYCTFQYSRFFKSQQFVSKTFEQGIFQVICFLHKTTIKYITLIYNVAKIWVTEAILEGRDKILDPFKMQCKGSLIPSKYGMYYILGNIPGRGC